MRRQLPRREVIHKHMVQGSCEWCGSASKRGYTWRFYTYQNGGDPMVLGLYCDMECLAADFEHATKH